MIDIALSNIRIVNIQPGDRVAVLLDNPVAPEEMIRLQEELAAWLPGTEIMILKNASIEVIRRGEESYDHRVWIVPDDDAPSGLHESIGAILDELYAALHISQLVEWLNARLKR